MFKLLKKTVAIVLTGVLVFTGSLFAETVSAASGPSESEKSGAEQIVIGETLERKMIGSYSSDDAKSRYFVMKTKRKYNLVFSVVAENDCTGKLVVQVWNSKGELIRNANSSRANMVYDKKNNVTKDEFTLKKQKPGKYYIQITESDTIEGRKLWVKGTVKLIDKVKNVKANQSAKGSKKVIVSWTPLTGEGITGYKVYCASKKNGKYKLVATVRGIKSKSAEVKIKNPNNTYYFVVKAYYFSINSDKNLFSKASAKAKLVKA